MNDTSPPTGSIDITTDTVPPRSRSNALAAGWAEVDGQLKELLALSERVTGARRKDLDALVQKIGQLDRNDTAEAKKVVGALRKRHAQLHEEQSMLSRVTTSVMGLAEVLRELEQEHRAMAERLGELSDEKSGVEETRQAMVRELEMALEGKRQADRQAAELREDLNEMKEVLALKRKAVEDMERVVEERSAALERVQSELDDKGETVDVIKAALSEKGDQMASLKATAEEQARTIEVRDHRIDELEAKISDLQKLVEVLGGEDADLMEEGASVDGMSVDGMSVDGMSVDGMSVDGASVDGASMEAMSMEAAPAEAIEASEGGEVGETVDIETADDVDEFAHQERTVAGGAALLQSAMRQAGEEEEVPTRDFTKAISAKTEEAVEVDLGDTEILSVDEEDIRVEGELFADEGEVTSERALKTGQ